MSGRYGSEWQRHCARQAGVRCRVSRWAKPAKAPRKRQRALDRTCFRECPGDVRTSCERSGKSSRAMQYPPTVKERNAELADRHDDSLNQSLVTRVRRACQSGCRIGLDRLGAKPIRAKIGSCIRMSRGLWEWSVGGGVVGR